VVRVEAGADLTIWGKALVVENRPGAGGTLGTQLASRASPDGYSLLLGSSGPLAIGPHLYPNAGYDPRKDFTPIMNVAGVAQALVVSANSKYRTIDDLIKAANAAPGKLNFASSGLVRPSISPWSCLSSGQGSI